MVTAKEFNHLSYQEQTEFVLKGTFLADRLSDHHYVRLYALGNYYVEVYFDDSSHLITSLSAFANTLPLTPYLEQLRIAV